MPKVSNDIRDIVFGITFQPKKAVALFLLALSLLLAACNSAQPVEPAKPIPTTASAGTLPTSSTPNREEQQGNQTSSEAVTAEAEMATAVPPTVTPTEIPTETPTPQPTATAEQVVPTDIPTAEPVATMAPETGSVLETGFTSRDIEWGEGHKLTIGVKNMTGVSEGTVWREAADSAEAMDDLARRMTEFLNILVELKLIVKIPTKIIVIVDEFGTEFVATSNQVRKEVDASGEKYQKFQSLANFSSGNVTGNWFIIQNSGGGDGSIEIVTVYNDYIDKGEYISGINIGSFLAQAGVFNDDALRETVGFNGKLIMKLRELFGT
ncbi:MAG: hypothetical protein WAZ19_07035 [Anaerolineae bacterium]